MCPNDKPKDLHEVGIIELPLSQGGEPGLHLASTFVCSMTWPWWCGNELNMWGGQPQASEGIMPVPTAARGCQPRGAIEWWDWSGVGSDFFMTLHGHSHRHGAFAPLWGILGCQRSNNNCQIHLNTIPLHSFILLKGNTRMYIYIYMNIQYHNIPGQAGGGSFLQEQFDL